ncbi:SPRY domain-containing SOCS box protein 4 isoform X2 [Corythoichthys intestinalis]|uniref:SPRY domain-containing SOCS box protein 4 isoform X2 n=1 Tax=Corythoichthys intestinalis TaxID=161448 RepID=UPI0025A567DA|nr:SPRY domain-containing SOCS box protein 4 isoform X2 [Corythoichthys intestinalis]
MDTIRGCLNGRNRLLCGQTEDGITDQFIPMGLSLSRWLQSRTKAHVPSLSAFNSLAVPMSSRLNVILNDSPVPPGHSCSRWSSVHCSPHFLLSADREEVMRLPVELSSDGVRAEKGLKDGLHVWEVTWKPNQRGSHAVLGLSRQSCPLQASGYNVLVGADSQSWGWELQSNHLWHDGQSQGTYPEKSWRYYSKAEAFPPWSSQLVTPDADAGTIGFIVDGHFLGVAFKDLPRGVELFPAVSSVRGGACIRLRYLNGAISEPPALMALCILLIRHRVGLQRKNHMDKLCLPPALQHYLLSSH